MKATNDTTNVKDSTEQQCMVDTINKLADPIRLGMGELSQKMVDFEATITETIKKQVLNIVTHEIENIKEDFNHKIHQMRQELQSSTQRQNSSISNETVEINRALNIVVRNLPETRNENTTDKVNTLVKDGLKIHNILVTNAVRKESKSAENGVIVASCKDKEDKEAVMKAKAGLKDHRRYNKVFSEHDKSVGERKTASNLRTIAKILGRDKVTVRGSRIFSNTDNDIEYNREGKTQPNADFNERRYRYDRSLS